MRISGFVHVEASILLCCFLAVDRPFWRITARQIASITGECLISPGYFANVCRRLSLGWAKVPGCGLEYVLGELPHDGGDEAFRMRRYLDEISGDPVLSATEVEQIDRYRRALTEKEAAAQALLDHDWSPS